MNNDQARGLALKFKKAWPKGPHEDVWTEELASAGFGQCEETYRVMIRDSETPPAPTVGRFFAVYRSLEGESADDRLPNCSECGSTGWVQVIEKLKGHDYPSAKPCRCVRGKDRQGTHRKIVADNEALFDRLQPGRHVKPLEPDSRGLDF